MSISLIGMGQNLNACAKCVQRAAFQFRLKNDQRYLEPIEFLFRVAVCPPHCLFSVIEALSSLRDFTSVFSDSHNCLLSLSGELPMTSLCPLNGNGWVKLLFLSPCHQDPAKVFKGTKMPGRMGNTYNTNFGLKVRLSEYIKCTFKSLIGWLYSNILLSVIIRP